MEKGNSEIPSPVSKDKQKLIIVGVLGVLVIGIGAFQFMGGEPPKKSVAKKAATDAKPKDGAEAIEPIDEKKIELGRLIVGTLPQRDPFRPVDIPAVPDPKPSDQATEPVKPETVAQTPPKPEPTRSSQPNMGSMRPPSLAGQAPLNPMAGLPPAGAIGGSGVAIQAGTPLRQPGEPAYSVAGVVIGKEKMVVLQDDSGNQRLVKLGEKIDPDNRIVRIDKGGKVTVRNGKKTMDLPSVPAEAPKPGSSNPQGQPTL